MAITLLQSKGTGVTGVSTIPTSLAYTSNNTLGSLLILTMFNISAEETTVPTDSQGNTWHLAVGTNASAGCQPSMFYAMNAKAGANTVTPTIPLNHGTSYAIYEFSGIATSAALDQINSAVATNSVSITTTANGELVFVSFDDSGAAPVLAVGSGWTPGQLVGFTYDNVNVEQDGYQVQGSLGAINTSGWSTSGSGYGNATLAVLIASFFVAPPVVVPTVTTQAVSSIATTTATGNGTISATGGANPTVEGVVINTVSFGTPANGTNPATVGTTFSNSGSFTTGAFTVSMTGLTPGQLYYACAYATNSAGTSYGSVVTFTTLAYPTVVTNGPSNIGTTAATGNGNLTNLGGAANASAEGFMWQTSSFATPANGTAPSGTYVSNSGTFATGVFTGAITGLTANTNYWVCAFATTTTGTSWGAVQTFTTAVQPALTTTNFKFGGLIW